MRKPPYRVLLLSTEVTLGQNEIYFSAAKRAKELGAHWIFRACENRTEHYKAIQQFSPDLIVDALTNGEIPDFLQDLPVVSVGSTAGKTGVVQVNEKAIGARAAEHLIDCGYRELAFLGHEQDPTTDLRIEGFLETAAAACAQSHTLKINYSPAPWLRTNPDPESGRKLREWLSELPKPVGLSCLSMMQAASIGMICSELGLHIPDTVGILGVGGASEYLLNIDPGISTQSVPLRDIGKTLAEYAHATLEGKRLPRTQLFEPGPVQERGSTDIRFASDPLIANSIRYIEEALNKPLRVDELARRAGVSRSSFEQRFRAATGLSPLGQIHQQRIEKAKQLLRDSSIAIKQVAVHCGVNDPYQFSTFFKKHTGTSPRKYRESLEESLSVPPTK